MDQKEKKTRNYKGIIMIRSEVNICCDHNNKGPMIWIIIRITNSLWNDLNL